MAIPKQSLPAKRWSRLQKKVMPKHQKKILRRHQKIHAPNQPQENATREEKPPLKDHPTTGDDENPQKVPRVRKPRVRQAIKPNPKWMAMLPSRARFRKRQVEATKLEMSVRQPPLQHRPLPAIRALQKNHRRSQSLMILPYKGNNSE